MGITGYLINTWYGHLGFRQTWGFFSMLNQWALLNHAVFCLSENALGILPGRYCYATFTKKKDD